MNETFKSVPDHTETHAQGIEDAITSILGNQYAVRGEEIGTSISHMPYLSGIETVHVPADKVGRIRLLFRRVLGDDIDIRNGGYLE